MHILLANNIYPPIMAGGAELIVSYLAEELVRRGNRVTVVSTCGPEMEPYPTETRNGVEVVRFFPRNRYWHFDRGGRSGLDKIRWHLTDAWNRDALRKFSAIVEASRPDVLNTHLIDGLSASIWRVARRAGIPIVHTAHDYHLICPRAFMLSKSWKLCLNPSFACRTYRKWHISTTRDVDLFCSPSQFLIDRHVEAGLKAGNTRVVANGIRLPDIDRAGPARPHDGPLRLLMPIRLTVEKGISVVLEAMRILPADLPVVLDIAGKGPLEADVVAAAAADPRIRFHGFVTADAKHALFSQADVFVLPSLWYENAPVVIVEAAAYGLGIIASRIGAIPEFVEHERTGLLFEPGSAEDLARTITRLAGEPSLMSRFRSESSGVANRFTVEAMADAYEAAYAAAAAERKGDR